MNCARCEHISTLPGAGLVASTAMPDRSTHIYPRVHATTVDDLPDHIRTALFTAVPAGAASLRTDDDGHLFIFIPAPVPAPTTGLTP